jgi:hypothetical protein
MLPEETQEGMQQEQPVAGNGAGGNGAAVAPAVVPAEEKTVGKNVILPQSALARIKGEQRERGKKEALAAIDEKIKAAGFASLDDAFSLLGQLKKGQQAQPQRKPEGKQQPQQPEGGQHLDGDGRAKNHAQYERERNQWMKERQAYQRKVADGEKHTRDLKRRLDAKEAEIALREAATVVGIKDADYAQRLLTRHCAKLSPVELKKFDERTFFEGLRETHPYLFGEIVRPATTGTGAGAPASRQPGTVAKDAAASKQIDVTKMSREEFAEHLRKKGMSLE